MRSIWKEPTLSASLMSSNTLFYGSFVHSVSLTELEYLVDALVYVSDGTIAWIEKEVEGSLLQETAARHGLNLEDSSAVSGFTFVQLDDSEFICPGLIDTHTVSSVRVPCCPQTWLIMCVDPSSARPTIPQSWTRTGVRTAGLATTAHVSPRSKVYGFRLCAQGVRRSCQAELERRCESKR
jgi:hypothetical protein